MPLKQFSKYPRTLGTLNCSLLAPPHILTTILLRVGCAEFTKESQETVPETGCLQGTSALDYQTDTGSRAKPAQESRFGSVMQLKGLILGLPGLYVPCANVKIFAELCLSLVILTDSKNKCCIQSAKF